MSGAPTDTDLITLMHELESFVRQHLQQPEVMLELRQWMSQSASGRYTPSSRVAARELVRAFELVAPGLMVDFLAENSELINLPGLRRWAAERENLHQIVMDLTA